MHLDPKSLYVWAPVLLVACSANILVAWSQASQQRDTKPVSTQAQQTFASTCANCHGLDGRGGERAPNIADRPSVQRLSDAQLFRIIENGIPGTGMPAFHSLESSQIKVVVTYLRTLQGAKKTINLPGNPGRGETVFSGKAGCSGCHMVAGKGGFIASDLTGYARIHAAEQIRSAIIQPTLGNDVHARRVTVTVRGGGETYVGRVRNEDNFSLQMQALDGTFHFMSKSDIERLEYDAQTLMPADYGSRLSADEMNDVVSYLISAANTSTPEAPRKVNDEE